MALQQSEIEGYTKLAFLGKGGYGEVYAVRDNSSGEVKAAKALQLRGSFWKRPVVENARRRKTLLEREIDILLRLSMEAHPNIVQLLDFVSEAGSSCIFLVMPLLLHGNLLDAADRLDRPFLAAEVTHMLKQLADGLAFMHQHGIIHRDLKLQNVLVADVYEDGSHFYHVIKLADFGLSKVLDDGSTDSRAVGTRLYRAPEGTVAPAKDLWSLGVLLYVMLTGPPGADQLAHGRDHQWALDAIADSLPHDLELHVLAKGLLQLRPEQRMSLSDLQIKLSQQTMPGLTDMRRQPHPAVAGLVDTGLADAGQAAHETASLVRRLQAENDAILARHLQDVEIRAEQADRDDRRHASPARIARTLVNNIGSAMHDIVQVQRVARQVLRRQQGQSVPYPLASRAR